jgi:hypothetical protein
LLRWKAQVEVEGVIERMCLAANNQFKPKT